mgnify:CR=1 FL=1|tara:strand:+ start:5959 stop:6303 length:345 start_codon:yes stop_codon:yes gene_type:complete
MDNTTSELTPEYFNNFYNLEISYNPSEVDAVIGYFLKRGFERVSAINTASVLLQQAKIDDLNVQELLDTLKGVTEVQLSLIVAQILNFNREKTSVLGFRDEQQSQLFDQRNVVI